jgi:DNA-binding transcriptional MerR regulator
VGEPITIGKVAAAAAMSIDTIRYYERLRLIPKAARTAAGYRVYSAQVIHRLMVVRNAQQFGFSLKQIAAFLGVRDRGGRPCADVRSAAQRLLDAVDRQIAELMASRERMQVTLKAWDRMLTDAPPDRPAHLLEALAAAPDRLPAPAKRKLATKRAGRRRA